MPSMWVQGDRDRGQPGTERFLEALQRTHSRNACGRMLVCLIGHHAHRVKKLCKTSSDESGYGIFSFSRANAMF